MYSTWVTHSLTHLGRIDSSMTQTTQAPTRKEIVKQELATLAFITRGGNWLFLLLSRLAEPLMFLSVLYVIAETVLPGLFKAHILLGISSACSIVLNTAPEVRIGALHASTPTQ